MFKNIVNVLINVWERNVGGCYNWQKYNQFENYFYYRDIYFLGMMFIKGKKIEMYILIKYLVGIIKKNLVYVLLVYLNVFVLNIYFIFFIQVFFK